MTFPAPTLIEGWYYHQDGPGRIVHGIRTMPEDPGYVRTLGCGQVWLQELVVVADQRVAFKCVKCVKAEPRWRARDAA